MGTEKAIWVSLATVLLATAKLNAAEGRPPLTEKDETAVKEYFDLPNDAPINAAVLVVHFDEVFPYLQTMIAEKKTGDHVPDDTVH